MNNPNEKVMKRFENWTVIVTGGARGLGAPQRFFTINRHFLAKNYCQHR